MYYILWHNRKVKISWRQWEREQQWNVAVVSVTFLYKKRWTTHRFHFVIYYNENKLEHRKNTRNDDVSTQKYRFRTRRRCLSEILTCLLSCIVLFRWSWGLGVWRGFVFSESRLRWRRHAKGNTAMFRGKKIFKCSLVLSTITFQFLPVLLPTNSGHSRKYNLSSIVLFLLVRRTLYENIR